MTVPTAVAVLAAPAGLMKTRVHIVANGGYDFCMAGDSDQRLVTVRETARRLGVHENTVRNWVRDGVLKSARVPGSRFHRFSEAEIERLIAERANSAPRNTSEEQWSVGPELVDATQLSQWAATKDAQVTFPELVRRLLSVTAGVTNVSVRSGDGTSAPGWDGSADVSGAAFLPTGRLRIEVGVSARPKAKVDADYAKRSGEPDAKASIFVFITPRRWAHANAWQREHQADGKFRGVRVLDADDLEGWLRASPSVHHWISEHLGRNPDGAQTIEKWWDRFSGQTEPRLPRELFAAGRDAEVEQIGDLMRRAPSIFSVRARWRDEAVAVVEMANEWAGRPLATLVVSSADSWSRLARQPEKAALVPLFAGPDTQLALDNGHHVILPIDGASTTQGTEVTLPRLSRQGAASALRDAGVESSRADRLAALARRSPRALVRRLALNQAFSAPEWATNDDASAFGLLALVGSWSTSEADLAVVSTVTGLDWDDLESTLTRWAPSDDPPFGEANGTWQVNSPEETLELLRSTIPVSGLKRWVTAALDVFLERDPRLELGPDERFTAGVRGVAPTHSPMLRRGLARGLALMGTMSDSGPNDFLKFGEPARSAVRSLLAEGSKDRSGRLWASLSDVLPLLAEAAPEQFLAAVESDLESDDPLLPSLFQDGSETSWLFSASPHTGLLWALETVSWSKEHLVDAVVQLAQLAVEDPGGRLSNRPLESLSSVLVPWVRHTGAPVSGRIEALEAACSVSDAVGWKLTLALWPALHSTSSPPNAPTYRDWLPDKETVSLSDWFLFVSALSEIAVTMTARDHTRWTELIGRLDRLPPELRASLLEAAEVQLTSGHPGATETHAEVWHALRKELDNHLEFSDADWALAPEELAPLERLAGILEPPSAADRYSYLFDWRPRLPNGPESSDPDYESQLETHRADAVRDIDREAGIAGLRRLAERVANSQQVGWTLGAALGSRYETDLIDWLGDGSAAVSLAGAAWARRVAAENHPDWLFGVLSNASLTASARLVAAQQAPPTAETWDLLERLTPDLVGRYWEEFDGWRVQSSEAPAAVDHLLRHQHFAGAIHVLSSSLATDEQSHAVTPAIVLDTLQQLLLSDGASVLRGRGNLGYEIGRLLDHLVKSEVPDAVLAPIEFALFQLLENYRVPRSLFRVLAADPNEYALLVKRVFRGRNEPRRELSTSDQTKANHAWWVLEHWKVMMPGERSDGTIDHERLANWVREARNALSESDRTAVGDRQIGQVLSRVPTEDGAPWPAAAVREILEAVGSDDLMRGVSLAAFNDRGPTMRSPYAGGELERLEAAKFRKWAQEVGPSARRTSRMLRDLAAEYDQMAVHEDMRAQREADDS